MLRSKRPRPTTTNPITAPLLKATRSPLLRLDLAALAVLEFAAVAIFMPRKPERPENKPPVRKAKGTKGVRNPAIASAVSMATITAKNIATPVYCLFRYALAPLRIADAIFSFRRCPRSFHYAKCQIAGKA